jgi:transposase
MNRGGDWQEQRRLQALVLYRKGWRQKDIAEALGVSKGAVSQWMARVRAVPDDKPVEQEAALKARSGKAGYPPKTNAEQRKQLAALLDKGAEAFGFVGQFWTVSRVRFVLKKEVGVLLSPRSVWKLLKAQGFSCQKPTTKAKEQNEKAIAGFRGGWTNLKRGQTTGEKPLSS